MPKKEELPKEIFVVREHDKDCDYLNAGETAFDLAQAEEREVGVYQLIGIRKVRLVAEVRE